MKNLSILGFVALAVWVSGCCSDTTCAAELDEDAATGGVTGVWEGTCEFEGPTPVTLDLTESSGEVVGTASVGADPLFYDAQGTRTGAALVLALGYVDAGTWDLGEFVLTVDEAAGTLDGTFEDAILGISPPCAFDAT